VNTPYVAKNYKQALRELEAEGQITADPPITMRKQGTFANHVKVTFK
jgi:hypothetical protein